MREKYPEYHKVNSIYKRDRQTNRFIPEFSCPEFEDLLDSPWRWSVKIDGTNVRIGVEVQEDGTLAEYRIGGRTDRAQMPPELLENLADACGAAPWGEVIAPGIVTLYGEGYGARIQKGGGLYRNDQSFILFDIRVGDFWLERDMVVELGAQLGFESVPTLPDMTLREAEEFVRAGFKDERFPLTTPEGIVGHPRSGLKDRRGKRIVVKIKGKDFEGLEW